MKTFVLQHTYIIDEELNEETKLIGIFESKILALQAVEKLKVLEGFKSYPEVIDCIPGDEGEGGFIIDEYKVNEVNWTDGFVSV